MKTGAEKRGGFQGKSPLRIENVLRIFTPAGLAVCIFYLSLFVSFFHLEILSLFCTYEGTVPYQSLAQMTCRELGVSFVALVI
jgi:hypothetical protein